MKRALLFILCLSAIPAWAGATYRASAAGGDTAGTSNRTATITPAVGDLLIVWCSAADNTQTSPTVTDDNGSGTYTVINGRLVNSVNSISVAVRDALMTNTTSTIVTCGTGSNTAGSVVIVAVSGMTRTGASAVRQNKMAGGGSGTTPETIFDTAADTNNMTIVGIGNLSNPAGVPVPTNWTSRQNTGQITNTEGLRVATRDSGFSGTTITWGSSGTTHGEISIELDTTANPDTIPVKATGQVKLTGQAKLKAQ